MKQHAANLALAILTAALLTNTAFSQFFGIGKNRSYQDQVVERNPHAVTKQIPGCATENCKPKTVGWGYHYERWSRWPGSPTYRRAPLSGGANKTGPIPKVEVPSDLDESSVIQRNRGADDDQAEDNMEEVPGDTMQPMLLDDPPTTQPEVEREIPLDVVPEVEEESTTTDLPDSFFDDEPQTEEETPSIESTEPSTDDLFDDFESDSGSPLDDLFDESSMFDLDKFDRREPRRIDQRRIARNYQTQRTSELKDIPVARQSSLRDLDQTRANPPRTNQRSIASTQQTTHRRASVTMSTAKQPNNPLRHVRGGLTLSEIRPAAYVESAETRTEPAKAVNTQAAKVAQPEPKEEPLTPNFNPLRGR